MSNIALSNLIAAVAQVLNMTLTVYMYIILARALVTWVNPDPYNPIVRFLFQITEPVLRQARRIMPRSAMIDLSPMLVIIVIYFLQMFVIQTMLQYAIEIRHGGGL